MGFKQLSVCSKIHHHERENRYLPGTCMSQYCRFLSKDSEVKKLSMVGNMVTDESRHKVISMIITLQQHNNTKQRYLTVR